MLSPFRGSLLAFQEKLQTDRKHLNLFQQPGITEKINCLCIPPLERKTWTRRVEALLKTNYTTRSNLCAMCARQEEGRAGEVWKQWLWGTWWDRRQSSRWLIWRLHANFSVCLSSGQQKELLKNFPRSRQSAPATFHSSPIILKRRCPAPRRHPQSHKQELPNTNGSTRVKRKDRRSEDQAQSTQDIPALPLVLTRGSLGVLSPLPPTVRSLPQLKAEMMRGHLPQPGKQLELTGRHMLVVTTRGGWGRNTVHVRGACTTQ